MVDALSVSGCALKAFAAGGVVTLGIPGSLHALRPSPARAGPGQLAEQVSPTSTVSIVALAVDTVDESDTCWHREREALACCWAAAQGLSYGVYRS